MLYLFISHLTLVVGQKLKKVTAERSIPSKTEKKKKNTTNKHTFQSTYIGFKNPQIRSRGFCNLSSGSLNKMRTLLPDSCVIRKIKKGMSFFFICNKNKGQYTDLTL